jgi:predicted GNAT family acetyltransferase
MAELIDNLEASRYELRVDGALAAIEEYALHGDTISYRHTETLPDFQGQGLARELVLGILDTARQRGLKVIPQCGYVAATIRKNPEYVDLVPEEKRAAFGL